MAKQVGGTTALGVAAQGSVLLVRDATGNYYELILEGLNAMFIPGEWVWTTDKLDSRNAQVAIALTAVAGNGGVLADVVVGVIAIPTGEVWIVSDFDVVATAVGAPGACTYNILVSSLPKTAAGTDKAWLDANHATPDGTRELINISDGHTYSAAWVKDGYIGELGCQLRILGPASITLALLTTVAFTGVQTQTITLTCMGRKVNKLVT